MARERADGATVVFYVHSLEHLRRGGRIGSAAALFGSALAIKPILSLRDGHIEPVEKVRTSGRALSRMVELAVEAADAARGRGELVDVSVQHLDFGDKAEKVAGELRSKIADAGEVIVGELGAVVGAHVGPGTVAITVSPRGARGGSGGETRESSEVREPAIVSPARRARIARRAGARGPRIWTAARVQRGVMATLTAYPLLALVALAVVVVAFFIGAVNPASIIAKVLGKDLSQGSGNPGATNAGRVMGRKWGVLVGVLDVSQRRLYRCGLSA
ncbi:MAG: glycerol-3-phosphate acyltransferase [Dermatophilaceae bacterium]